MLKKALIIILLSVPLLGNAQSIEDWQVGINVNPFYFDRLSSYYEPTDTNQNIPNGIGFGLTIEKNWNNHWGIKTGIEFSYQNKKYDDYQPLNLPYSTTLNMNFEYYNFPITIQYSKLITENLYLTFNQGIQFSILNDYKTVADNVFWTGVYTPNHFVGTRKDTMVSSSAEDSSFRKNQFGILGSIGVKGFLTKQLSYSSNVRYSYDFTSSENSQTNIGFYPSKNENANNFRLGLELGLQYHFSLKGCASCALQKH